MVLESDHSDKVTYYSHAFDVAQVPGSTSCNNAIALPAFWYPFKHQLKYPSSIPILTLSGRQHPPEHFYSSPFLCHSILQSQHR